MSKFVWAAAVFCIVQALPAASRAADYPFTGLFNFPPDGIAPADATLYCAYNFFAQNADGSFTNYHLDLPRYQKDGTIRYLVFTRGQCSAESGKIEICTTKWDVEKKNENQTFYDVILTLESGTIEVGYFESVDDARSFVASGDPAPSGTGKYYRCPFDASGIARYRTDEESSITPDERQQLTLTRLDPDTRKTMSDVLAAVAAGK